MFATGLAIIAGLLGINGLGSGSSSSPSSVVNLPGLAVTPAAASTLDRLAARARAAAGNTAPLGPHQYEYLRFVFSHTTVGPYDGLYRLRSTVQMWSAPDGRQRWLTHYLSVQGVGPKDRTLIRAHPRVINRRLRPHLLSDQVYTDQTAARQNPLSLHYGRGLPSAPKRLYDAEHALLIAQIRKIHPAGLRRQTAQLEMFYSLATILAGSLSQTQRAAAYTDLKYVHGVQIVGRRRDHLGRSGIAIQLIQTAYGTTTWNQLIVDPATGALLEQADWSNRSDPATGQLRGQDGASRQDYLGSGVVGSVTALPDGDHVPTTPNTTGG